MLFLKISSTWEKMICRILLLIILTSRVSGSFVVNVTQTSYQAEENHNITLEWMFTTKPDRSPKTLNILCELITEHTDSVLYRVQEGVEVSESQDEKFSGRVESDKDALGEGRIRLQLFRLRTDDSGLYLCELKTDYGFGSARCRLSISASDDPKRPSPTVNTQPESRGWLNLYPLLILPAAALLIKLCYKIIKRKHNLNLNSHRLGSECSEAVVNLNNSDATHLAASLEATSIIF
ncbi:uncharacterized protein LOC118455172 isoform X1 [Neolamprologus brichardi]|uniref:uncharacterized protein LOC118455172 isoform X1 n=1 Tax=Neolamprologus brichardi TaxID=32507 RepID=UPI00164380B5|nr:uncharacterized protein LOC118455172 isoform X1 [Neolamprologus brichardi]